MMLGVDTISEQNKLNWSNNDGFYGYRNSFRIESWANINFTYFSNIL